MTRICFLGSSHIAALKLGADALLQENPNIALDVRTFGAQGDALDSCVVETGKVFSDREGISDIFEWTSGGHREIILSEYDAIYVVAGPSMHCIQPYLAFSSPKGPYDLPPISEALFKSIQDAIVRGFAFDLASKIARMNPDKQVFHIGEPFLSDESPTSKAIINGFSDPENGLVPRVTRLKQKLKDRANELATDNFKIIHPPTQALEKNRLFTRGEYCRDSIRLEETWDVKHGERDYVHMNAKYGQQLIENLLKLNHPEVLETKTAAAE